MDWTGKDKEKLYKDMETVLLGSFEGTKTLAMSGVPGILGKQKMRLVTGTLGLF